MAYTLLLDANWDLTLDAEGNMATVIDAYAIAQNVANAVRLFTKDAYFNQDEGIPHFDIELGHQPPLSVLRSRIVKAAQGVDGVADVTVNLDETMTDRVLRGEIFIMTTAGEQINVEL